MSRPHPGADAYQIGPLLGRGGFGRVYEAIRQRTGRRVALKLLSRGGEGPPLVPPDPTVVRRFRDEARILSLIEDRAVVKAEAPVLLETGWAVVMDLASGTSVGQILEAYGLFPASAALELVAEVARALGTVYHHRGPDGPLNVLHRDLKPSNLQLSPSGEVWLLDFGNARADFHSREYVTTRHIGGTFGYIAPRAALGARGPRGRHLLPRPGAARADSPGCATGARSSRPSPPYRW